MKMEKLELKVKNFLALFKIKILLDYKKFGSEELKNEFL